MLAQLLPAARKNFDWLYDCTKKSLKKCPFFTDLPTRRVAKKNSKRSITSIAHSQMNGNELFFYEMNWTWEWLLLTGDSGLKSAASPILCRAASNCPLFMKFSANFKYISKLGSPGGNLSPSAIRLPLVLMIRLKSSAPAPILTDTIRLESTYLQWKHYISIDFR